MRECDRLKEWDLGFNLIQDDQIRVTVRLKARSPHKAVKKADKKLKAAGINAELDYCDFANFV